MAVSKQKPIEPNPLFEFLDEPQPNQHPSSISSHRPWFFGGVPNPTLGLFAIGKELPWSMFTKRSTQSANQIIDHLLEKADGVVWYVFERWGLGDVFFCAKVTVVGGCWQVPRGVELFFFGWMVEMVGWVLGKLMSEGTQIKEATWEN